MAVVTFVQGVWFVRQPRCGAATMSAAILATSASATGQNRSRLTRPPAWLLGRQRNHAARRWRADESDRAGHAARRLRLGDSTSAPLPPSVGGRGREAGVRPVEQPAVEAGVRALVRDALVADSGVRATVRGAATLHGHRLEPALGRQLVRRAGSYRAAALFAWKDAVVRRTWGAVPGRGTSEILGHSLPT